MDDRNQGGTREPVPDADAPTPTRIPHTVIADQPLAFVGCIELREIPGRRARDKRELMAAIAGMPAGSLYYHTHSLFLRHPRITEDAVSWVPRESGGPLGGQAGIERMRARGPLAVPAEGA